MSSAVLLLGLLFTVAFGGVVKRSDDVQPWQDVVSRLSMNVQSLESLVASQQRKIDVLNTKVGFMTSVQKDLFQGAAGERVKFTGVQYNQGGGYDPLTGIFTAPVAGLYCLFFKTESRLNVESALRMKHDGTQLLYIYTKDVSSFQTSSGVVVEHLSPGSRVWVESAYAHNEVRTMTRFGGFLVHTD